VDGAQARGWWEVPKYNIDAINACMSKAQDYSTRFRDVGDTFENATVPAGALGELPSSGAVSSAMDNLNAAMNKEFDAAFNRLDQVAHALDAVCVSAQNVESENARSMSS
jgi:hypothetical protein